MATKKEFEKISNLETDVKVLIQRMDTIENNHLKHMKEDINSLNLKVWGIVTLALIQLCAVVLTRV